MKQFIALLLLIIACGCICPEQSTTPTTTASGEPIVDVGTDWNAFSSAALNCDPVKVTRTDKVEGFDVTLEIAVLGGNPAACQVFVKPKEMTLPADASDEEKMMASVITMLDMTCTIEASKISNMNFTTEDLENCEGSLADTIKAGMESG